MPFGGVEIAGLRDLTVALRELSAEAAAELGGGLKAAGQLVADDAEQLAGSEIRNVSDGDPWSQMRVGATTGVLYVAPKQRGSRGRDRRSRPNMGDLLAERATGPALDGNEEKVVAIVGAALEAAIRHAGF